jgi:hypothetical protein
VNANNFRPTKLGMFKPSSFAVPCRTDCNLKSYSIAAHLTMLQWDRRDIEKR